MNRESDVKGKRRMLTGIVVLSVLSSLPIATSQAYTECSGLLTKVMTDAGGQLYVSISENGLLNGFVSSVGNEQLYKTATAIALVARSSNASVTLRFARDGISCGTTIWNEPIEGIAM